MNTIIPIKALGDNYIWLYANLDNNACFIVDPGDAEPVINTLSHHGFDLKAILITHHHFDHCAGVADLLNLFDIPVYAPRHEKINGATHLLAEGDTVTLPEVDASFEVLDIPAHTLGHIAYYGLGVLFTGDTLFTGSCGRLFEGTPQQLFDALSKLSNLPDETLVYCGHEYTESNLRFAARIEPDNKALQERIIEVTERRSKDLPTVPSTIACEKATNPFLRTHIASIRSVAQEHAGKKLSTPVDVLRELRRWKDHF